MKKPVLLLAGTATLGFIGISQSANACADGCYDSLSLVQDFYQNCTDLIGIAPANDTRSNLLLLMLDRDGKSVTAPNADDKKNAYVRTPSPFVDWSTIGSVYSAGRPDKDYYDRTDGTICQSNKAATLDFVAAVKANSKLTATDRDALVAARSNWQPACIKYSWEKVEGESADKAKLPDLAAFTVPAAKQFADYMKGADAFYAKRFDEAATQYRSLAKADDKWVREAATYMIARAELNSAQASAAGKYGNLDMKEIDKSKVEAAGTAFDAYLKAYPKGRYANSAAGLKRRVWWLAGDNQKLSDAYQAAFRAGKPMNGQVDELALVEEIDIKMPKDNITEPLLLAMTDLQRMRPDSDYGTVDNRISRSELEGQRALFAKDMPLFDYLRAAHAFTVGNNPKEVLSLIPDAAKQKKFSNLQFSRQSLRGQALEATKDVNARGFWLEMIGGAEPYYQRPLVELAIALHDEQSGKVNRVFAADSVVTNKEMRSVLLRNIAGPDLLRQQAVNTKVAYSERETALFMLLEKSLSFGQYKTFLDAVTLIPSVRSAQPKPTKTDDGVPRVPFARYTAASSNNGYACPSISDTAKQLQANPKSVSARLCYGEFVRINGILVDPAFSWTPQSPELGSSPSQFKGTPVGRLNIYRDIIADKNASADDKAYALYRAVNCYAPAGGNACGNGDVPESQRKAWFQQLKRDYPKSRWAIELKYYW